MIVSLLLHLLQLSALQILGRLFTSSANFHTDDFAVLLGTTIKSLFRGIFGIFGRRNDEAMAA